MRDEKDIPSFEDFLNGGKKKENKDRIVSNAEKGRYKAKSRDFFKFVYKREKKVEEPQKKIVSYTTKKDLDFLKFYIIVEYYYRTHVFPELSMEEFKFLFLLYSEPPFTYSDYKDYEKILDWNTSRFNKLKNLGILVEQKKLTDELAKVQSKRKTKVMVYTLSPKVKSNIKSFYNKLLLYEKISENPQSNPMFKKTGTTVKDRRFAKKIVKMNNSEMFKEIKQKEDWKDLHVQSFAEFLQEYNKGNDETMVAFKDHHNVLKRGSFTPKTYLNDGSSSDEEE